ncbi:calcium-dependent protein kinase 30-like isoform X2 [Lycium ferocissimum]|uniref:calcium-dependent protein kinase 30-like isoform X2 n=1 Tax=Lycium ferocissimum TaxID=112874 RepID=UPI0028161E0B|nr:calcium-dependent protein kinase 30-like isoform X2 [Lycium ferocissimum]XP_059313867.1 calcium-dependent protein kinase 30-like isoform X2 [Lycium ferocissimum]
MRSWKVMIHWQVQRILILMIKWMRFAQKRKTLSCSYTMKKIQLLLRFSVSTAPNAVKNQQTRGNLQVFNYPDREFVAILVHLRKMTYKEHLQKAFEFFDKNQNDYIEIEELREALHDEIENSSEEVINAIMQDVDTAKIDGGSEHGILWNQFKYLYIRTFKSNKFYISCDGR